jgi:hypothetical protein
MRGIEVRDLRDFIWWLFLLDIIRFSFFYPLESRCVEDEWLLLDLSSSSLISLVLFSDCREIIFLLRDLLLYLLHLLLMRLVRLRLVIFIALAADDLILVSQEGHCCCHSRCLELGFLLLATLCELLFDA